MAKSPENRKEGMKDQKKVSEAEQGRARAGAETQAWG